MLCIPPLWIFPTLYTVLAGSMWVRCQFLEFKFKIYHEIWIFGKYFIKFPKKDHIAPFTPNGPNRDKQKGSVLPLTCILTLSQSSWQFFILAEKKNFCKESKSKYPACMHGCLCMGGCLCAWVQVYIHSCVHACVSGCVRARVQKPTLNFLVCFQMNSFFCI